MDYKPLNYHELIEAYNGAAGAVDNTMVVNLASLRFISRSFDTKDIRDDLRAYIESDKPDTTVLQIGSDSIAEMTD
jgi:hypothetical protein